MNRGEEGDYAKAIRLANEVIASDEFGLEDKYEDIFANGYSSKELMFTRHIKTPPSMDDNVGSLFKMFGGATYKPTEMYFEILTQDDKRYEATFDSVMLGNGTGYTKDAGVEETLRHVRRLPDVLHAGGPDVLDQGRGYGSHECLHKGLSGRAKCPASSLR